MTKFNLALLAAFMSDIVPTVTIKTDNGPVDINMSDFDATKHEIADAADLPPLKPLDPKDQVALFGSSKQPSGWTVNGETLQLGTVVQTAFERSSLSIEEWNKLAQDTREELIAAVVAEMVPPVASTGFKVGKNGKRGHASKFVILDAEGKIFNEDEYDTQEEAETQAAILNGEEAA